MIELLMNLVGHCSILKKKWKSFKYNTLFFNDLHNYGAAWTDKRILYMEIKMNKYP